MIQEIKEIQGKRLLLISLFFTIMMMTVIAPSVLGQKTDFTKEDQDRIKSLETQMDIIKNKWSADVGATAYWFDSQGSLKQNFTCSADVYDGLGSPELGATCLFMALRPNASLMTSGQLPFINGTFGHYETQFSSDNNESGVYKCNVRCVENVSDDTSVVFLDKLGGQLLLKNQSDVSLESVKIDGISSIDVEYCHPIRWIQDLSDTFGNLEPAKFIDRLTDIDFWFDTSGGGGAVGEYDLILKFYKITPFGTVRLGSTIKQDVILTPTDTQVSFSSAEIGKLFDGDTDTAEMEICVIPLNTTAFSPRVKSGGSENSNFTVESLAFEDPQQFSVGGSAHMTLNDVNIFKADVSGINATVDLSEVLANQISINDTVKNSNSTIHSFLQSLEIKIDSLITGQNQINNNLLSINVTLNSRFDTVINKLDNITANLINIPSQVWSFVSRSLTAPVDLTGQAVDFITSNVSDSLRSTQGTGSWEGVLFNGTVDFDSVLDGQQQILIRVNDTNSSLTGTIINNTGFQPQNILKERKFIEGLKDNEIITRDN